MGTPKPRSPTLLLDYTSEDIDLFLHGGHFGRDLGFRTFRMWRKNDTLFFSDVYNHILTESGEFLLLPKNTRNYKWAYTIKASIHNWASYDLQTEIFVRIESWIESGCSPLRVQCRLNEVIIIITDEQRCADSPGSSNNITRSLLKC